MDGRTGSAPPAPSTSAPALFICTPVMDATPHGLRPAMQDARRDSAHLGVYLLLGHLRRADRPCDVLDWVAQSHLSPDEVATRAGAYEVVFFSCNSLNWAAVRLIARRVRELSPRTVICIGGPHPTLYPDAVASSGVVDAFFRGEADDAIVDVYDLLLGRRTGVAPIEGLWHAQSRPAIPGVVRHGDLHADWLPDYRSIPDGIFATIPVETSRGCKYRCAFCSIPSKNNWRGYAADVAARHLGWAVENLDRTRYRKLTVVDDTFTTDHERIQQLCRALGPEFEGRLMYDATLVDLRDTALIDALTPFTSDILVGAEVVTRADAKRITKATGPELIHGAARNLQAAGIAGRTVFSFIMGFPWQSVDDCLRTVQFIGHLILDYGVRVYLQWYWPMPGSRIWDDLAADGRVDISIADTPGFYRSPEWFYSIRDLSPDDLMRVDERVRPLQMCLTLANTGRAHRPLEYSAPDLRSEGGGWETRRNPFIAPAAEPEATAV